jgi:peptidoglycan hydrolase-like protein with peptidoglycan-binding domain
MRHFGLILLALTAALPALAQAPKGAAPQKPASPSPIAQAYAAMPLADRLAIQSSLIWTGDYNGLINGEFGERAMAAVRAFQKSQGAKETAVLNPRERTLLAAAAKARQEAVGWKIVDDPATATRLGLPTKLVAQSTPGKSGTRFASPGGEVAIETFRIADPGVTLQAVLDQQKKEPGRKTDYSVLRPDFFVMSGLQGEKRFYIRAQSGAGEVRGVTILSDPAMDGVMGPVTVAMSSAFVAFPSGVAAAAPVRRKVEYATGIVVSASGHVVTDRQATDGCHVISLEGFGPVERIAEERTAELALLRLFGAKSLQPVALATDDPKGAGVTLLGVPDPQSRADGSEVAAATARLGAGAQLRPLDPAPAPGFSGGAVLDSDGRLLGIVRLKTPVVAGPASAATEAVMVPVATIRKFLEQQDVALPPAEPSGIGRAKSAIARVICVRK